jgi:hypothetical protein
MVVEADEVPVDVTVVYKPPPQSQHTFLACNELPAGFA